MKLAMTIWNHRVAPVFDVASCLRIMEVDGRTVVSTEDRSLAQAELSERLVLLKDWGVKVLVCGAISKPAQDWLWQQGIELHGFVAGDVQTVMQAWLEQRLESVTYRMPGCQRRGQGRQCRHRRGRCS